MTRKQDIQMRTHFPVRLVAVGVAFLWAGCGHSDPVMPPSPILFESTFDSNLDGWSAGTGSGALDDVYWADGHVVLDGSDYGAPDMQPNAWISRTFNLPTETKSLRFDTSADSNGGDSELRVRLVDQAQTSHVLLDWQVQQGANGSLSWEERWLDIAVFAGQTVTIFIEQGDNDVGVGELRHIDNVQIRSDVEP